MIQSMLGETCKILRRQEDSRDTWNEYDYAPSSDVACLMLHKKGYIITSANGDDIVVNSILYIIEEVTETDKIIYDDYEYEIVSNGIMPTKNPVTLDVEFYQVALLRKRPYTETQVEIKRR